MFLNEAERSPELLFFSRNDEETVLLILSKSESGYAFSIYDIYPDKASPDKKKISLRGLLPLDEKIQKPVVFSEENGLYIVDFNLKMGQGFKLKEIIEESTFFQVFEGKSYIFNCERKEFSPECKFTIENKVYLQVKDQNKLWRFDVETSQGVISLVKSELKSPNLQDKALIPSNVYSCQQKLYVLSQSNDSQNKYLKTYQL